MFNITKQSFKWGGQDWTLETGHMARQADGAVVATCGDTVVLATVCYARQANPGLDFFPLTVNYQEKFYASGRIPGGFFRREGRPTEKETLVSRLIDRPIRPLFAKGFKNETQVVATVLSADGVNDPDMVAMVASSAALAISGVPFLAPISAARVGWIDGKYVLNPTYAQREDSALDLVVAGTEEGVLMVESEAAELSEEIMLGAVTFGHEEGRKVIAEIAKMVKKIGKPTFEMPAAEDTSKLMADLEKKFGKDIAKAYGIQVKQDRVAKLDELKEAALNAFAGEGEARDEALAKTLKGLFKELESNVVRGTILDGKARIDGRTTVDIRPITAEVDVLPRAHGSALFTRGETQALVIATLGTSKDEQIIDAIEGESKDAFMLHYNFPPFSVGEVGRIGFTGRREIGHGKLARRALERLLPTKEEFPYTMRVVSEITESNGSSSMATVCGTSLALMAAGVPMAKPVAGIAMGLIKEGEKFQVLSDILGDEDHLGDMDFKVAGSADGITALQMDIKITSITREIMATALAQAKNGRMHILGEMAKALAASRGEISKHAPGMATIMVPKDKIREVIGSGGKVIRELTETTGCSIDIEDDGTVFVASVDRAAVERCIELIEGIIAEPEINMEYDGEVTRVTDFGAFVRFLPNQEGLVHVSEMVDVRVENVEDILHEGESVRVKVINLDDRGKVRLTLKGVEQSETIQARMDEVTANPPAPRERSERDDRGNRDRDRGRDRGRGGRDGGRRRA